MVDMRGFEIGSKGPGLLHSSAREKLVCELYKELAILRREPGSLDFQTEKLRRENFSSTCG